MGKITGKLRIAIRVALAFALDAMPETSVKSDEKPIEASTITTRKSQKFWTGLLMIKIYKKYPTRESKRVNRKLYNILERRIALELATE